MVSVVILSFNTREITLKCLECLARSKGVDLEIIVIDNASTDGSAKAIAKAFPEVRLIVNKINNGFAAGQNQGMRLGKGEYLLSLNSDCFVEPDTIAKCLTMGADVLGCKLLNSDETIQPSWGYFVTLPRVILLMSFVDNFPIVRKFVKTIHVRDISRYTKTQEVDWVMGAFVLVKKKVFEDTGGFDERYFMYGEEMEWMYRIKRTGYKVWYFSQAQAVHLHGVSVKSTTKMLVSEAKGYIYWFSKHRSVLEQRLLKIILVISFFYKAIAWSIMGGILGKPSLGKDNFNAFLEISGLSGK